MKSDSHSSKHAPEVKPGGGTLAGGIIQRLEESITDKAVRVREPRCPGLAGSDTNQVTSEDVKAWALREAIKRMPDRYEKWNLGGLCDAAGLGVIANIVVGVYRELERQGLAYAAIQKQHLASKAKNARTLRLLKEGSINEDKAAKAYAECWQPDGNELAALMESQRPDFPGPVAAGRLAAKFQEFHEPYVRVFADRRADPLGQVWGWDPERRVYEVADIIGRDPSEKVAAICRAWLAEPDARTRGVKDCADAFYAALPQRDVPAGGGLDRTREVALFDSEGRGIVYDAVTKKARPRTMDDLFTQTTDIRVTLDGDGRIVPREMPRRTYRDSEGADVEMDPERFLDEVSGGNPDHLEVFWSANSQLFCHTSDDMLHLIGEPGTGKSTTLELMRGEVGDGNWVNVPLTDFDNRAKLPQLSGAYAVLSDELPSGKTLKGDAEANLITACAHGVLTVDVKYRPDALAFRFDGLVVQASNAALTVKTKDGGITRRKVTLEHRCRFDDGTGHGVCEAIRTEFCHDPEVVGWFFEQTMLNHFSRKIARNALTEDSERANDEQGDVVRRMWANYVRFWLAGQRFVPFVLVHLLMRVAIAKYEPNSSLPGASTKAFRFALARAAEADGWDVPKAPDGRAYAKRRVRGLSRKRLSSALASEFGRTALAAYTTLRNLTIPEGLRRELLPWADEAESGAEPTEVRGFLERAEPFAPDGSDGSPDAGADADAAPAVPEPPKPEPLDADHAAYADEYVLRAALAQSMGVPVRYEGRPGDEPRVMGPLSYEDWLASGKPTIFWLGGGRYVRTATCLTFSCYRASEEARRKTGETPAAFREAEETAVNDMHWTDVVRLVAENVKDGKPAKPSGSFVDGTLTPDGGFVPAEGVDVDAVDGGL